ncbi:MAG: sporulation protein YqfD [Peptococcaceae bacterium]|nr:sporulation protein YqfD [Peptococcaceae bacterium]
MYKRVKHYGRGFVRIEATGDNLEVFLNEALETGVVFFNTRREDKVLYAGVRLKDYAKAHEAARLAEVDVRVLRESGLPFVVLRWGRRRGLLVGIVLILATVLVLSQFVLSVSVEGNVSLTTQKIVSEADKLGIRPWVYRGAMDIKNLEKQLAEALPECTWISVEERGTDILIRVVEKAFPPQVVFQGNLVAERAGIVEELMVIQGLPMVKEGDTVREGQVLIEADVPAKVELVNPAEPNHSSSEITLSTMPVAKGFVRGRTWYSAEVTLPLQEYTIAPTGLHKNGWGIKAGERVIMITHPQSPYEECFMERTLYRVLSWRNWRVPVEIIKLNYQETRVESVSRTVDQAMALAEEQAQSALAGLIPQDAQVLGRDSVVLFADDGYVRIRVQAEVFENLAVYTQ